MQSTWLLEIALTLACGYMLGCFNTGYYLTRLCRKQDLRSTGSGNAGAMNCSRILGPWGFLLTFLGDALKGCIAVWIGWMMDLEAWTAALGCLAAVTGHIYPIQLNFRGGRGIATAIGGMLALSPWVCLAALAVMGVLKLLRLRFMAAGLIAIALSPLLAFTHALLFQESMIPILALLPVTGLILLASRPHLHAMMRPNESKNTEPPAIPDA